MAGRGREAPSHAALDTAEAAVVVQTGFSISHTCLPHLSRLWFVRICHICVTVFLSDRLPPLLAVCTRQRWWPRLEAQANPGVVELAPWRSMDRDECPKMCRGCLDSACCPSHGKYSGNATPEHSRSSAVSGSLVAPRPTKTTQKVVDWCYTVGVEGVLD